MSDTYDLIGTSMRSSSFFRNPVDYFFKKRTTHFELLVCHNPNDLRTALENWGLSNPDAEVISTTSLGNWSLLITYKK